MKFLSILAKWRGLFSLVPRGRPSFPEDENALKSGKNQECGA